MQATGVVPYFSLCVLASWREQPSSLEQHQQHDHGFLDLFAPSNNRVFTKNCGSGTKLNHASF